MEVYIMYEQVRELLIEELQIDERLITPNAELIADLDINSIELADMIMICEEKFDVTIEEEDLSRLITVGDVAEYLESLQK